MYYSTVHIIEILGIINECIKTLFLIYTSKQPDALKALSYWQMELSIATSILKKYIGIALKILFKLHDMLQFYSN